MQQKAFSVEKPERSQRGRKNPRDSDGETKGRPDTIKRVPVSKHEREGKITEENGMITVTGK